MSSEATDAERNRIRELEAALLDAQKKNAEIEEQKKDAEARAKTHDDEARRHMEALQPEVNTFLTGLRTGQDVAYGSDIEKTRSWSDKMLEDTNPHASLSLARTLVTASVRQKRMADEITTLKGSKDSVSEVLTERDDARSERDVLRKKNDDLVSECAEKQSSIEKLAMEIKKYEMLGQAHPTVDLSTHQFSKLSERESDEKKPAAGERPSLLDFVKNTGGPPSMLYTPKGSIASAVPGIGGPSYA